MAEADAAPGEERGEPANGDEPVKDFALLLEVDEVGEEADGEGDEHGDEGPPLAVNVGENLGGVGLLCEGGEGTRRAEHGRVADGDDGEENDGVHDTGEDCGAHALNGNDKRTGRGVNGALGAEQAWVVVGNEERDKEQRDNVEDGNAPEHLSDGSWDRFAWIGCLGGSEADKFGTGKGKGCRDENAAESLEAIFRRTRIGPISATNVAGGGCSANVDNDTEQAKDCS